MNLKARLQKLETAGNTGVDLVEAVHWRIIGRTEGDGLPHTIVWTITPNGVDVTELYD
jgi:diadenosine tetraphosphate (Ap4A) HIT family hydrolase